ncbi:calcium-binding protein [Microvirga calopogonii]|uniref:calcium-binding protein n=1 Tax=Microvirga calopogonii TaxID=2078013 RepID=UPI000E0CF851|nr:calcium-binding protein [Microvirga calopogonii]
MTFSIEQALDAFFNNSGGGGIQYGGTGTSGTITGNVTGGSGTGSSYPIVTHSSDQSIDTQTAPGTQDYCESGSHGINGGETDENGNLIYIDIQIYAPRLRQGDETSVFGSMVGTFDSLKYDIDAWLARYDFYESFYGRSYESRYEPQYWLYETYGDHFSDGHVHPVNLVLYADEVEAPPADEDSVGGNSTGEVSSFTVRMTFGSSGNDTTYGASGSDFLLGGDGNDIIYGYGGNDTIQGGAGADTMDGGDGIDTLDYREDTTGVYIDVRTNSAFYGQAAGDVIRNFENVIGGSGHDTIYGSHDANMIWGGNGKDIIAGAGGDDSISGNAGNDALYGDAGNDLIIGGEGADTLDGGDGIDTLSYIASEAGVYIDVRTNTALYGDAEGDRISNFENVTGGSGNDTIYGSHDANELDGSVGNDIIAGAGGHDTIWGGNGFDYLYGDDGNDIVRGEAGNDVIQGGAGADTLDGGDGSDWLDYRADTAGVYIDLRTSSAFHGEAEGDRISNFENVIGGSGRDTIYGSSGDNEMLGWSGDDILAGADGDDALHGQEGNDWIEGGNGWDLLTGGAGDDRLVGGAGIDVLTGDQGRDTFVFDAALGPDNDDLIYDFSVSEDTIALSRSIFGGFGSSVWVAVGQGAGPGGAQIVYDDTTGNLFYDADGAGGVAQVKFAHLTAGLTLTSGNFVLI